MIVGANLVRGGCRTNDSREESVPSGTVSMTESEELRIFRNPEVVRASERRKGVPNYLVFLLLVAAGIVVSFAKSG